IVRARHFDVPIPNRWLSRHVYTTLSDHLLATSPAVAENLQKFFGLPPSRVSTLPTGIDLDLFSPGGKKAELIPSSPSSPLPLIGMVAVLRRAKGHAILLKAARLLRDSGFSAHYVFVGDGPIRAEIEQKIAELN